MLVRLQRCFYCFSLREPAGTLAELAGKLKLLETLQGNLPKTEAQIHVIHEQFAVLDKYEVSAEEEVKESPSHRGPLLTLT